MWLWRVSWVLAQLTAVLIFEPIRIALEDPTVQPKSRENLDAISVLLRFIRTLAKSYQAISHLVSSPVAWLTTVWRGV